MLDTMTRYLSIIREVPWRRGIRVPMYHLVDRYSTQPVKTAGLVIKAGGGTLAKIGATDFYATVQGVIVTIAAATDMPALTGINILAGNYNVVCFFVDGANVVTVAAGTQGATLAAVTFPQFPNNKALVGFLIITYASAFTGGTTALDTATTVYVSPVGAFDPTVLL